jgi:hypothetical protein
VGVQLNRIMTPWLSPQVSRLGPPSRHCRNRMLGLVQAVHGNFSCLAHRDLRGTAGGGGGGPGGAGKGRGRGALSQCWPLLGRGGLEPCFWSVSRQCKGGGFHLLCWDLESVTAAQPFLLRLLPISAYQLSMLGTCRWTLSFPGKLTQGFPSNPCPSCLSLLDAWYLSCSPTPLGAGLGG